MLQRNRPFLKSVVAEPYRLFFPLGILFGIIGIGHWLFYALGWTANFSVYFHGFLQTHLYLGCFASGFLFTSVPRFSQSHPATWLEVAAMTVILLALFIFISFNFWIAEGFTYIFFLIAIGRFIVVRFRTDMAQKEPTEFVWIPLGILHGILGTLIYLGARLGWVEPWLLEVGKEMSQLGFILCVVLGVGGFLAPRLMGTQKLQIRPVLGNTLEKTQWIRKRRMMIHGLAGFIIFISFWLEGLNFKIAGFLLRALVITSELMWTGSLPFPPKVKDIHATPLWISMWMVTIGSWALVFFPDQKIAMLHFIFIGGFSLMIFSVSTVVILSHAGQSVRLHHKFWVMRFLLFSILFSLAFRIAASYFPERFFPILAHASAFWLAPALLWFIFMLPKILTVPNHPESNDISCQN